MQSPVQLQNAIDSEIKYKLEFDYYPSSHVRMMDDGHFLIV
jgi:hypothetical protein